MEQPFKHEPPNCSIIYQSFRNLCTYFPSNKLSRALLPTTTTPPPSLPPSLLSNIHHSFIWGTGTQIQTLSFSFSSRGLVQLVVFSPILGSPLRDHLPFSSKMKHPTSTGGTVRPFSSSQTSDRQAPYSMGGCFKCSKVTRNHPIRSAVASQRYWKSQLIVKFLVLKKIPV